MATRDFNSDNSSQSRVVPGPDPDAVAAHSAALDWLMGRINYERTAQIPYQDRQLKLDRMRQLLTRLGQPDAGMKIVHVAGTKGKGSTSAMISSVLSAAGYRTGLFSSPHLERIEERFAVDGRPCTARELVALVDRLRPIARAMDEEADAEGDTAGGPTYFEVTTAMALLHFVESQVDAAVLEVGLGGRLDSTNVCLPCVSVITTISFDHMKQLGHTLAEIAREKAGIIKPGVPVICGVTAAEPQAVIAEIARNHGCRLSCLGRDFNFDYRESSSAHATGIPDQDVSNLHSDISYSGRVVMAAASRPRRRFDFFPDVPGQGHQVCGLTLAMRGAHQAANAAVALATIDELRHQGWCISEDAIRLGLGQAALPGRVEVIGGEPLVVIDAAHNPASARALVETLAELPAATRRTLIVSISHDKDALAIVAELAPHFDRFVVTRYQENPRSMATDELASIVRNAVPSGNRPITACNDPRQAWRLVNTTAVPGELVCITGSFYLVAEMRPIVRED